MQDILHEQKYRSQKVSEVVKVTKQHTFPINGSFHEYFTVTFWTLYNFCTLLLKEICKKSWISDTKSNHITAYIYMYTSSLNIFFVFFIIQ